MKNNNGLNRWVKFEKSFDGLGNVVDSFMRPMYDGDLMRTDIKETENAYLMDIELPGYDKKDISISVEDGYVNVKAEKAEKCEETDKESYIRQERSCSCERSYYMGEVEEDAVKAKYENGVLSLNVPKKAAKSASARNITID